MNVEAPKPAAKPVEFGVVVPHKPTLSQRALAWLIYAVVRLVVATLRFRWDAFPTSLSAAAGPHIFCAWHNRLPLGISIYRGFMRAHGRTPRLAAIVSASRDGAMMARLIELFGIQTVRGSSSKRGAQAMLELASFAERGHDIAVTPDGPRGPRYVCKEGAIYLAQLTGLSIVPGSCHLSWKICLKSWDRFQIPLPFSRATMTLGEPLVVPRDASVEVREALRRELDRRLLALTKD
jgi:lysophospholipid acyltransferase (LPLAT)-like uncharacterized protein